MKDPKGKVLVTGGAGFIGSRIAESLRAAGYEVRALDRSRARGPRSGSLGPLYHCDVTDPACVAKAVAGYDVVVHNAAISDLSQAAVDPKATEAVNVTGTLNLLRSAADLGVRKFILASSAAVYGETGALPVSESLPTKPVSVYGRSKLAAEEACAKFARAHALTTVALRYFNVYGKGQRSGEQAGVIASFVDRIGRGERPRVFGDGMQTRDFISVDDVVRANLLAVERDTPSGEALNVGTGRATSMLDLARMVSATMRRPELEPVFTLAREGDVTYSCADTRKSQKVLGFSAKVELEEGLKETIAWLSEGRGRPRKR